MSDFTQDLGTEISGKCKFNGLQIIQSFIYALEDANFHKESFAISHLLLNNPDYVYIKGTWLETFLESYAQFHKKESN